MQVTQTVRIPGRLVPLAMLARLLQRLEASEQPVSAEQYRLVVDRLAQELQTAPQGAEFDAVLEAYPAARELYENLHYQHAGLCRSPLEPALNAELEAARGARAPGGSRGSSPGGVRRRRPSSPARPAGLTCPRCPSGW
jgi:hypothetical protein